MKNIILVGSLFFLLPSCATTLRIYPVASEGQHEIYQEGMKTLISAKQSLVAIKPSTNTFLSNQPLTFVVSVLNGTQAQFNFSTEDLMVFADGKLVKVFTYDDLVAEIRRNQAWAAIAVGLNSAAQLMNSYNAGYTYHSGTYKTSYYSNYGYRGYGHGLYSGYSYNPAAQAQAQTAAIAQTQANMDAIRKNTDQALNKLSSVMLKKTTVFPQMLHGGYIKLQNFSDPLSVNSILVKVNAGGELHEFKFNYSSVEKTALAEQKPPGVRRPESHIVNLTEPKSISNKDYSQNLVLGKTTKQDVQRDFGKPVESEMGSSGKYEYWAYLYRKTYSNSVLGETDNVLHKLILKFDNKGILNDYRNKIYSSFD